MSDSGWQRKAAWNLIVAITAWGVSQMQPYPLYATFAKSHKEEFW
jgi:hypothetical protein